MPTVGSSKQSTGQQGKTILKYCKGKTYIAIGAWAGGNYRKSEELVHHVRCRVVQTKQITRSTRVNIIKRQIPTWFLCSRA